MHEFLCKGITYIRIDEGRKTTDRDEADGESDAALPDKLRNLSFVWKEGDKRANIMDTLGGSCHVTAMKGSLSRFTLEAHFCPDCKKMIIDTDVTK